MRSTASLLFNVGLSGPYTNQAGGNSFFFLVHLLDEQLINLLELVIVVDCFEDFFSVLRHRLQDQGQ